VKPVIGLLVCGDNHFIVSGPPPAPVAALALARHWTIIQIGQLGQAGEAMPPALQSWGMVTRAFRENLEWAVVVPGDGDPTPAVTQLLQELSARGIAIRTD
jgi:hypothetical protein